MADKRRLGTTQIKDTELIRVDKDVHKILKILAAEKEMTMRRLMRQIVEFYVQNGVK